MKYSLAFVSANNGTLFAAVSGQLIAVSNKCKFYKLL